MIDNIAVYNEHTMATKRGGDGRTLRSGGNDSPTRRQWLASAGAVAVAVLAGCSEGGSGDRDGQGGDADDGAADDEEDDDPVSGDESDKTETLTETGTDTGEPDGTETETGTEAETETESETAVETNCNDVVPEIEDSMDIEGTMEHPEDGTIDVEGREHEDDLYLEFVPSEGPVMELYIVDDEQYTVTQGNCYKSLGMAGGGYSIADDEFQEDGFWEEKDPVGTELLDGEEMVVYDHEGESPSYDYELTIYVSCSTRRIHRVDEYVPAENSTTIGYYDNWGGADPVSPPEMDCQEV